MLPAGLFVVGLLAVAHSVVTVLWQEPFTRIGTARAQDEATIKLSELMQRPQPLADAVSIAQASGVRARLALVAERDAFRTARGDPVGRIRIAKIGVHFTFLQGTDEDSLKRGPGHYIGTAMPGQHGTIGMAGHRTTYEAPFRNIDKLKAGDRIVLTMPYGTFTYRVQGHQIVKPSDAHVLRSVAGDRLVLTACWPLYSAAKRIAVTARLVHVRSSSPGSLLPDAQLLARMPQVTVGPRRVRASLPPLTLRPQWNVAR